MSKSGGLPCAARVDGAARGSRPVAAATAVSKSCRQAVAGKLAVRQLAAWARPFGVGETEFRLLWLLVCGRGERENSAMDQVELAQRLAVSAAQVSNVVERLRIAGLVEGIRDSGDRRRQLWRLTAAGVSLVDAVVLSVAASEISPLAPPCEGGGSLVEDAA